MEVKKSKKTTSKNHFKKRDRLRVVLDNRTLRFENYVDMYAKNGKNKPLEARKSKNPINWEKEIEKSKFKKRKSFLYAFNQEGQKIKKEKMREELIEKIEVQQLESDLVLLRKHQEQAGKL